MLNSSYKCTARDFSSEIPDGCLTNKGEIDWNPMYYKRMSKTTIEYEKCEECNLLPACCGPCSQKLLEYKKGHFETICNSKGVEKTIESMMQDFYHSHIVSTQF